MANSQRISWIDIARGIGIIAVLYGHAVSGDSYRHLLYAFHMPLFFFLSGTVFHPKRYPDFIMFLKKNITSIMVPYFFFALLSYLIWFFARTNYPPLPDILHHWIHIFYGNSSGLFFNIVLWFLPVLFVTKISFWFITKLFLQTKFIFFSLISVSIIGYIFSIVFPGIKLPFGIETAITAVVFYGFGYLWSQYAEKATTVLRKYRWLIFLTCLVLSITFATINFNWYGYQIDMRLNRYSNYFLFYGAALSGIFATLAISSIIGSNRILEYIGKHSLPLFVWHIIVFTYLTQFTKIFIAPDTFNNLRNLYIAPAFTILATILILGISFMYKKLKETLNLKP